MAAALNLSNASAMEASCFNATTEEAYDDLRAMKTAITTKAKEVVKIYRELKDIPDDDEDENVDATLRKIEYNSARGEAMEALRNWYVKTGEVIRMKPGTKPAIKIVGAHAFMKVIKGLLRKTTPLGGGVEDEEDTEWLAEDREAFPMKVISAEDIASWAKAPLRAAEGGIGA